MERPVRLNLPTTAAVLALGLVVSLVTSTVVAARAYAGRGEQSVRAEQTLTVKGSTRQRVRSDRAVWRIDVRGENADLKLAFAGLEDAVQRVRGFLESLGFAAAAVDLAAIETTVHYARDAGGRETRDIVSYELRRGFSVDTPDVDRIAQAAARVTELIQDGVLVISDAPQYYYTALPDLRIELMGAAARDARARAEEIARNAGCRVAEVRDARMGVLQVTRPFSTEVSDYGMYDLATIDKDVQAVVTVTFRIAPQ